MKRATTKTQRRQPEPLIVALQKLDVAPALKTPAEEFLTTSFAELKSRSDIEKAFAGLARCQQLLSPVNISYARALESERKLLVTFTKLRIEWCKVWFEEDVARAIRETLPLLENHLSPPAIWDSIKDIWNRIFTEDPPL